MKDAIAVALGSLQERTQGVRRVHPAACDLKARIFIGAATLGLLLSHPVGAQTPSTNDLWDVRSGITVTTNSPLDGPYDARDMFGGTFASVGPEVGNVIFSDSYPAGFVHFVEWRTPAPVTIRSFLLFASGDRPIHPTFREFASFRLLAKSPGTNVFDITLFTYTPMHPYLLLDETSACLLATNVQPTTSAEFRAEFVVWEGTPYAYAGPRILELDGFGQHVGMPVVVVDGNLILSNSVSARGSAEVTLSTTFPGGWLFYTLDGSDPAVSGLLYTGPFIVRKSRLLRTVAYNADFSQSVAGDPLAIVILPTLTALTDGGGSVAIEPPAGDYFSNALARVTATAAPGWTFLHWLGDATGTNPVAWLSMTRNKTVRAVFGTALNTTVVGGGSLVVSPLSAWHPYGNPVRLTAVPATGNYLAFWANAAAGRTDNPLAFTVTNANPTVTAVFASLGGTQTNALTVIPDGRGQVTLTPPGHRFPRDTNVVLQAVPESGQAFLGWAGAASGSDNLLVVTMNSNKVITASFTKRPRLAGEGQPDLLSQDGFRLTLTGEFGAAYEILGSPDFSGWTPVGTVTNIWGTEQFTDAAARTNAHRVYRARALE